MELPFTMKRKDGEGNFTVVVIDTNDIGIIITTTLPGKRPKQALEGLTSIEAAGKTVEGRITEIVNQKLGEGFFSSLLDGSKAELDYFIASFREESQLNDFLDKARESGVLKTEDSKNGITLLDFEDFVLQPMRSITGIEIAASVPRALRARTVPIFYAMKDFTTRIVGTEPEGQNFDLRGIYIQQQRTGQISAPIAALLDLVGATIRPLTANTVGRGRGTRFTVTL